ncbi:MAG TPA: sugar kinase [Rhizobiaceae bacterium]|nr:sugar kinase [Rhizobiaceae bacterium]
MKKVVVIGEILVEIMADTPGDGFRAPQPLTGPFPSGAPAIFADQMARLVQPVALVSAVGDDDFGRLNLERLQRDGVDVSAVLVDPDRPPGSAFVRYRHDGSRDFVFNIRHSAAGRAHRTVAVEQALAAADHVHVMGSSLSSPEFVALNIEAVETVRARGGTVSFDPNLRKEILAAPGMEDATRRILGLTDLFLPSGDEPMLFTRESDPEAAMAELLDRGIAAIVHKRGVDGATFFDRNGKIAVPAFRVAEVDPTGAGDCFGATFVAMWLRGSDPREALRLAAASGALAVTRRGPMEGTASLDELTAFIRAVDERKR